MSSLFGALNENRNLALSIYMWAGASFEEADEIFD